MKTNLPVTQVEVPLRDDIMIVSRTDQKGQITFVNHDFLEISGFSEAELIGESHNIVRHPDMPEEAFADMWRTLKAGKPWTGIVKNRCKNGGYYWVIANVTPIYESGMLVGYMSVRGKPTREQIEAHAAVYRLFKERRQGNLVIRDGKAIKNSLWLRANFFARATMRTQLLAILTFMALIVILVGAIGLYGMRLTMDDSDKAQAETMEPLVELLGLVQLLQRDRILILDGIANPSPENIKKRLAEFEKNKPEIATASATLDKAGAGNAQARSLLDKFAAARGDLLKAGYDPAFAALAGGNATEARRIEIEKVSPLNEPVKVAVKELTKFYREGFATADRQAEERFSDAWKLLVAVIVGGIVLSFLLGVTVVIRTVRSVVTAQRELGEIAQGNYLSKIDVQSDNEVGRMLNALKSMQTRLGFEVTETKRVAAETLRIKVALDEVTMPVTLSNDVNNLIYMNNTALALWTLMAAGVAQRHPGFAVDKMLGAGLAKYFEDDEARSTYQAELSAPRTLDTTISGRHLRITVCPVRDAQGHYLGRVSQWLDRTLEVATEKEIEGIVGAASNGDFTQRIAIAGKQGFVLNLAQGLNQLLETAAHGLAAVVESLQALAQGDLTKGISGDYRGTFGQLKDDTNTTIERLREVVGRIKEATEAINTASQEIAAGNSDLSSRTEEQASSLEETASSMEELNATVRQNADNARQANELSKSSNDIAVRGGDMVKRVVNTMHEIQDSSKKIADIIGVIDSIAFQTNILALNAAVEAARAGEQGRGFAVVATEVRNLAQRSAQAAKEIKGLIAESVDKVEGGAKLVDQAGTTMDEVVVSFRQVANLVTEISNASREQSSGIELVTQAVRQMDEVTQQNAALVEQAAAAAESLEDQARGLAQAVGSFKLVDGRALSRSDTAVTTVASDGLAVIGGMDFDAAITAHRQWRRRLLDQLTGTSKEKLDPAVVGCDDKCALGQWIYGSCKPAMGNDPLCESLRVAHRGFHQCAAEVIRHQSAGRVADARRTLSGEFVKRSEETVRYIEEMRTAWSGPAVPAPTASIGATPKIGTPPKQLPNPASQSADDEWAEF